MAFFAAWNCIVYKYLSSIPFVKNHLEGVLSFFGGGMPRVLSLLCAVLILCVFKNLRIPHSRLINTVASCTFGVYLLHENLLVNKFMWHRLLHSDYFSDTPFVLLYMICATLIVFAACTLLELLRKKILEKPLAKLIERLEPRPAAEQ